MMRIDNNQTVIHELKCRPGDEVVRKSGVYLWKLVSVSIVPSRIYRYIKIIHRIDEYSDEFLRAM